MRKTLKNILAEYGMIAVAVYLTLFTVVFVGSYFAIRLGWTPGSVAGEASTARSPGSDQADTERHAG